MSRPRSCRYFTSHTTDEQLRRTLVSYQTTPSRTCTPHPSMMVLIACLSASVVARCFISGLTVYSFQRTGGGGKAGYLQLIDDLPYHSVKHKSHSCEWIMCKEDLECIIFYLFKPLLNSFFKNVESDS